MKSSELMLGDLVLYQSVQISRVVSLGLDTVNGVRDGHYSPIPLTPEILEKNGFDRGQQISNSEPFDIEEEGYAYYQVGELGYLNPHLWGWYKDGALELPNSCTMSIEIRYVHELQHALRLCGMNELADNFKI